MRCIVLPPAATVLCGALLATAVLAGDPGKKPAAAPDKVVIPFDFESKFDDGRYGQMIGDMLWAKLQRQGGFVIPESMQEVRDWCQRHRTLPGPDTSLAKMKEIVVKEQAGDVGIWGKVERAPDADGEVYDLWIYVADFSADPPRMIYEKKVRTQSVGEIPHTYVKQALDQLYGRSEAVAAGPDPAAEERWQKGPNLVKGDFEKGRAGPAGWDPLPKHVTWVVEEGSRPPNHVVRFTIPEDVAESSGVLYYSDYFPVQEGATYRFQCRWRSTGPAVKVFIKCYDELQTSFRPKGEAVSGTEKREVYRSQQNLKGSPNTWNVQTEDFTPTHTQYTPRWGRVMLYGYYPAGTVEWDDIVVKQIAPPPPGRGEKDPRPSLETKVRTNEIK
jgi:hypothetical protein